MPVDPSEHFSKLQTLLKKEREEDRNQYIKKIQNRSIHDRRDEGVCWYPVQIRKSYIGIGEKWIIEIERQSGREQRHLFQAGATASLFLNQKNQVSVPGIISRIRDDRISLMLNQDDLPEWLDEGKLGLDLLFDESTYDEMFRTLAKLKTIKEGRAKKLIGIMVGNTNPSFHAIQDISYPYLNAGQNRALNLCRSSEDLALIHGPPGTGKTTTLVHCIKDVVDHEKQVLVCAPSNAAVDLLVEKLHNHNIDVVRLGHPARVTDEVLAHTLDVQMISHADSKLLKDLRKKSEEMRRLGGKYKRKYGYEEARQRKLILNEARKLKEEAKLLEEHIIHDILNKAGVIACTLIGANNPFMAGRTFKTLFIDESSQALEPACWVPVLRADRVIMAGDHKQLPPTIKSMEAAETGLSETIFERCIEKYEADEMLETQYRMHPAIIQFSNAFFYGGRLTTSESVLNRRQIFKDPLEFIDTAGCGFDEEINPETLSTFNTDEARFAINHLDRLLQDGGSEKLSIAVIAPYKAQIEKLRKFREDLHWNEEDINIAINTVDAFQGQERDVIYISLTRSNSNGEIGFLADIRRMNVAMTRARYKLVMIGDSATLSVDPFFDKMILFFQHQGWYHSAFEFL